MARLPSRRRLHGIDHRDLAKELAPRFPMGSRMQQRTCVMKFLLHRPVGIYCRSHHQPALPTYIDTVALYSTTILPNLNIGFPWEGGGRPSPGAAPP